MFIRIKVNGLGYPLLWTCDSMLVRRIEYWRKRCIKWRGPITTNSSSYSWERQLHRIALGIMLLAAGFTFALASESLAVRIVATIVAGVGLILTFITPAAERTQNPHVELMSLVHRELQSGALIDVSMIEPLEHVEAVGDEIDFDWLLLSSGLRESQIKLYADLDSYRMQTAETEQARAVEEVTAWLEQSRAAV